MSRSHRHQPRWTPMLPLRQSGGLRGRRSRQQTTTDVWRCLWQSIQSSDSELFHAPIHSGLR
eukprot:15482578-Alexandrium_andersonii.AAC.1